jgi:hypothetical protein
MNDWLSYNFLIVNMYCFYLYYKLLSVTLFHRVQQVKKYVFVATHVYLSDLYMYWFKYVRTYICTDLNMAVD